MKCELVKCLLSAYSKYTFLLSMTFLSSLTCRKLFLLLLFLSSLSTNKSFEISSNMSHYLSHCEYMNQPQYFLFWTEQYESQYHRPCIFNNIFTQSSEYLTNQQQLVLQSNVTSYELSSIPNSQAWSHCFYCGWIDNQFLIFKHLYTSTPSSSSSSSSEYLDLSWSQWNEFFHSQLHSDEIKGKVVPFESLVSFKYHISQPVYILPMITFHIGHILIDLLESLYHNMMNHYGKIRTDSLIVIDVAGDEEWKILQKKLLINCGGQHDSLAQILQLFTSLPIVTMEVFRSLQSVEGVIFQDIHFGLDITDSFYSYGYQYHPHVFNLTSSIFLQQLANKYQQFQKYIVINTLQRFIGDIYIDLSPWNKSNHETEIRNHNSVVMNILFIQRPKDRVIVNLDEIISDICIGNNIKCFVVDLALESFSSQLVMFAKADILVAVAGTAIHNLLFFRPGISVIILMQNSWCHYAWMYANQAVLLNMKPFTLCHDNIMNIEQNINTYHSRHWTRWFWKQGPRMEKSFNITVNITQFRIKMKLAIASLSNYFIPSMKESIRISHDDIHTKKLLPKYQPFTLQMFLSSVTASLISNNHDDMEYKLAVTGELGSDSMLILSNIGETMPHLSVCLHFISIGDTVPYCAPIHKFSYYSDLILHVNQPVLKVHAWLQSSSKPYRGKVTGTDDYIIIDTRRIDGGISLFHHSPSISLIITQNLSFFNYPLPTEDSFFENVTNNDVGELLLRFEYVHNGHDTGHDDRFSLQRYIHQFCFNHSLTHMGCINTVSQIYIWLNQDNSRRILKLPEIQQIPTPKHPFIFLHIEKTAGTTLREFIYEAAERYSLTNFIPCHGDIDCLVFSLDTIPSHMSKDNISVVAGHFSWNVWKNLPTMISNDKMDDPTFSPSCLVVGRHPIDRVISYYYHRCYTSPGCLGYNRKINELTQEELSFLLIDIRDGRYMADNTSIIITDEGMSDAACRTMTNLRMTTGIIADESSIKIPKPLTESQVNEALHNLDSCVIGLVESWEQTQQVIHYYFPWIDFTINKTRKRMSIIQNKETRDVIRSDLQKLILQHNSCDMKLYNKMLDIFEKEVKILKEYDDLAKLI